MNRTKIEDITEKITEYLSVGGLFNPEMMEHKKVSELLIDCRDTLTSLLTEDDGWISVEERLPAEGVIVLAYHSSCYSQGTNYMHSKVWQETVNGINHDITHWMPLPNAPSQPQKGGGV